MEVISNHTNNFFANGNKRPTMDQLKKDALFIDSPDIMKFLKEEQECLERELQFYEVVSHVLIKIEKESHDEFVEDEIGLWPEVSLLDMKQYLKAEVNTSGVTGDSPVFILEGVSTRIGRLLHSVDVFDVSHLATCTDQKIDEALKKGKNVTRSDIEFAIQDAKVIMKIVAEKERHKASPWSNLPHLGELNLKDNTQKIANFVWQFNPKGIVDALTRPSDANEDDGDAFHAI